MHLQILTSIDSDAFLVALRRFIAHSGQPTELYSDQGTNFRGRETELRDACNSFYYNPHFGRVWEQESRSVKVALYSILGSEVITKIEARLNSKPLGYVSSEIQIR